MFNLKPLSTDNLIDIIGILATIISIYLAQRTAKNAFLALKTENRLKKIDELPSTLNDFMEAFRKELYYEYIEPDEIEKKEYTMNIKLH